MSVLEKCWVISCALAFSFCSVQARELHFAAQKDTPNPDFVVSAEAVRVSEWGREAIRLEKGATIRTREPVDLPKTGFSVLLRIKLNELGDPPVGDRVHNHAILCHPSMALIITWVHVMVWHFPFPEQGKVAEATAYAKPGREMVLGWVLTPTTMAAYLDGQPIYQGKLPLPLAEKAFKSGPFTIGGEYGKNRALSLDVYEFIYADEPWSEEEIAKRTARTRAQLIPETFTLRPLTANPTLTAGPLQLWVNSRTGALDGFSHRRVPKQAAVRSLDIYRLLDGTCSSESEDRVLSRKVRRQRGKVSLTLSFRNDAIGLHGTKVYSLEPVTGELTKTITLRGSKPIIIAVESRTIIERAFRHNAFYTQWLHHAHRVRLFIPAAEVEMTRAAAPHSEMQSQLLLLTQPDFGWTYGEVPLRIDGEPLYPAIPDGVFGRKTLLTPDGWQVLRGVVELQPGKKHTIIISYRWANTSHLGFLRDYTTQVYRPAFAPQAGSRLPKRNLVCDAGASPFLCNLAGVDGEKLIYRGRPGVWALADLSSIIEHYLPPEAYGTFVVFEGFPHGDLLSDNIYQWIPEDRGGPKHGKTNIFRTSLAEYIRIMELAKKDMPRLQLGQYQRVGVMSYVTETPKKRADILAPPEAGAPPAPGIYDLPYFWEDKPAYMLDTNPIVFFELLGDYFARLVKMGLPIAYLDFSIPSYFARRTRSGAELVSWSEQIAAVREMARKVHAVGGTYFVNLPSGPFADFGYMEYTPWAEDNARDWRVLADRLQLTKAQEMFPNTTIPLYFRSGDYPLRCLAYNLVPSALFSGWFDSSGTGHLVTTELLRLRWALRDAEITGALVRPLPWEPGAPPVEACVMRLGEELYIPIIFHGKESTDVELSVDLKGLLGNKVEDLPVWRCDFVRTPWGGPADKPFTKDPVELKFTRLVNALDYKGKLMLKESLKPQSLTMILIGDWSKHQPFAPPKSRIDSKQSKCSKEEMNKV